MSSSQRRYCFTIMCDALPEWENFLQECEEDGLPDDVSYLVAGQETAPSTGKKHFQCYAEFNKKITIKKAQSLLQCPNAHFEAARGSSKQARYYCMETEERHLTGHCYNPKKCTGPKTEWFVEFGESKSQGKRSDLEDLKQAVLAGQSKLQIMHTNTAAWRYMKSMDEYKMLNDYDQIANRGYRKPNVRVYHSSHTGSGKTRRSVWEAKGQPYYMLTKGNTGVWWDGYTGQEYVIIDEFKGWIPFTEILRILDGYPCFVDTKGGRRMLNATTIVLTSNFPIEEWYPNVPDIEPLRRRISHIEKMDLIDAKEEIVGYQPVFQPELDKNNNPIEGKFSKFPEVKIEEVDDLDKPMFDKDNKHKTDEKGNLLYWKKEVTVPVMKPIIRITGKSWEPPKSVKEVKSDLPMRVERKSRMKIVSDKPLSEAKLLEIDRKLHPIAETLEEVDSEPQYLGVDEYLELRQEVMDNEGVDEVAAEDILTSQNIHYDENS